MITKIKIVGSHFEIDSQGRVFVFLEYTKGGYEQIYHDSFQVPRRQFEQVLAGKRPIERLRAIA